MSAQAAADAILAAARELKQLLGSRANDTVAVREHHSHGESYHTPAAPDIVCFPHTTDEVAAIVKIAAAHRLPIVPFGAGTSLEGHVNAIHGGVTIDLARDEHGRARQRRGSRRHRRSRRDAAAAEQGARTTPASPSRSIPAPTRRIGGMAATRASGTTAVRYGTMRENVLGLTVVLADGA